MNLTIEYLKDLIKDLEYARTEDEAICYSQIIEVSLPGLKAVLTAMIEQKAREDRGADRLPGMLTKEADNQMIFAPAVSRRDMFAMAAMQGMAAFGDDSSYNLDAIPGHAAKLADDTIAELDKGKP